MMGCVGAHNRAQGFCCSGVFQSFYTDVQKKQNPQSIIQLICCRKITSMHQGKIVGFLCPIQSNPERVRKIGVSVSEQCQDNYHYMSYQREQLRVKKKKWISTARLLLIWREAREISCKNVDVGHEFKEMTTCFRLNAQGDRVAWAGGCRRAGFASKFNRRHTTSPCLSFPISKMRIVKVFKALYDSNDQLLRSYAAEAQGLEFKSPVVTLGLCASCFCHDSFGHSRPNSVPGIQTNQAFCVQTFCLI